MPYHLARQRIRHLAAIDHRHSVHQHELHSFRELIRIAERRHIANRIGIEDHYVGPHPGFQYAAVGETHAPGRQRREFADRLLQRGGSQSWLQPAFKPAS